MNHRTLAGLLASVLFIPSAAADKISYEPLSKEASTTGQLARYEAVPTRAAELKLGSMQLKIALPTDAKAYDVIPVQYELTGKSDPDQRVAVEAVAFEDEARRKGRDLYDLAMPGEMKLKIEYLGSQTGIFKPERVSRLTMTSRHEQFPPYELEPFVRSGTVKRGNYLFFKFRVTNIGDTILDAEGFGGWMVIPHDFAVGAKGERKVAGLTVNQFERHLEYFYPGESFERWICFQANSAEDSFHVRTLVPGKHVISFQAAYRWNRDYNWGVNMWAGRPWLGLEVPIEVTDTGGDSPIETREVLLEPKEDGTDRMTRYVGSLEEFMTVFKVFESSELAASQKGVMYLQVAPWTRQVVVKLVGNTPGRVRTAAVPIKVSSDNLTVRHNPDNPFTLEVNGRKQPVFFTQSMDAMRTTTQLGPHPERHLRERIAEMKECGVNVLCSTAGDWHIGEAHAEKPFVGDVHAETFKYMYDVIVPEARIPVFGWGLFPAKTHNALGLGSLYWNEKFSVPFLPAAYTYSSRSELDVGHPDFPRLYAGTILFNYKRWGSQFYTTADGDVLIDVEDSWGWMRDDINIRYTMGPHTLKRFREWLTAKYGPIDKINAAWSTGYKTLDEIDPQKDQGNEGKVFGNDIRNLAPVYNKPDHPFHDWNAAVDDWDVFRTELRCDIYAEILQHVRKVIPKAQINIRTEGALIPVGVPKDSDNPHLRHIHYSQRRAALISEVLQRRKVFRYHSDYTTIPYTQAEWRMLLGKLRQEGIRGNYLPQFCTARNMLVNDQYGRDWRVNYNLPKPSPAVLMHVLQAAFPVWRIMYEEGHCPGVLWEDYMCDGFVTETQKQELRLFRAAVDAAR